MPNKTSINLNKSWVCEHLRDVTVEEMAWVLLQEPGFIGFGVVMKNDICFPPDVKPDWTLISDLRLFGKKGEWHIWRDWDGKHYARLLEFHKLNDDNSLTEYHFLWGTKKKESDKSSWIKLVEDRGAEIRLPLEESDVKDEKKDLPLRLKLKQIVDYDPNYHLAGIVDAALVGLVRCSDEELLFPTDSLVCSEPETTEGALSCSDAESSDTNPDA